MSNKLATFFALLALAAGAAEAQQKSIDLGRQEFVTHCASCHGDDGRGVGAKAAGLPVKPANLRLLSRTSGGNFPLVRVLETIDGRLEVAAHGPRDMPVWGTRFTHELAPAAGNDPLRTEGAVRERIIGLADYLYTLQD